ncbi:MAG TPA: hypothetical protein VKR58_06150 [Aquella sp.]|nr:hypothetical protein [Aquella sp.]
MDKWTVYFLDTPCEGSDEQVEYLENTFDEYAHDDLGMIEFDNKEDASIYLYRRCYGPGGTCKLSDYRVTKVEAPKQVWKTYLVLGSDLLETDKFYGIVHRNGSFSTCTDTNGFPVPDKCIYRNRRNDGYYLVSQLVNE